MDWMDWSSEIQEPYVDGVRPRSATYGVKPTQIPGLTRIDGDTLRNLAEPFIAAVVGSIPQPFRIIDYPASAFPLTGLTTPTADRSHAMGKAELTRDVAGDPAPVIFGYSQGASVITLYKRDFNAQYADPQGGNSIPRPTFVMIGNISRPNGGFFARIPGLRISLIGLSLYGATPVETAGAAPRQITTHDIVGQYDGAADFPVYPANLFALANVVLGGWYVHANYQHLSVSDAVLQGQRGDTAYYMIPAKLLPLLRPLAQLGLPMPLLAALDAPIRVLVEAGYNRASGPGELTPARLIRRINLRELAVNVARAIAVGIDDGLQQLGLGRPLGTTAAGPYGVGNAAHLSGLPPD
jgi:PE-PPE domain